MAHEIVTHLTDIDVQSITFGGSPKVPIGQILNGIAGIQRIILTSNFSATAGYFIDVTDYNIYVSAVAGDLLFITTIPAVAITGGSNGYLVRMIINDGGTDFNPGAVDLRTPSSGSGPFLSPLITTWSVQTTGTVKIKVQVHCGTGVSITVIGTAAPLTDVSSASSTSTMSVVQIRF